MSALAKLSKNLYHAVFRRTSTFVIAVVVMAYPFERAFNVGTERYFRFLNKGKFYDDIKGQFGGGAEEE